MTDMLPIDAYLDGIVSSLRTRANLVIVAEPGAGKTTRVPPCLLDEPTIHGRVLVLQPRRVAVRSTALRVADQRQERLGQTIGYRVRFDRKVSQKTRLEFLTEGVFLRELQTNPLLEGIAAVIFDEFHERSLTGDLAIAMCREVQRELRDDLKIIVMSATLDADAITEWLDAPRIDVPGRTHPVDVHYVPGQQDASLAIRAARVARRVHESPQRGHILVFLPGVSDIHATAERLEGLAGAEVVPLHGRLSVEAQDQVFVPTKHRRIILATNLAETSLTIPGVTVVIDSGLEKVNRYDGAIGLERLELARISQASAKQRAGRAGRIEPGVCYRLWSSNLQNTLTPYLAPEVKRADLSTAVLQILSWGTSLEAFQWFEAPTAASIQAATRSLNLIGAIDDGAITNLGRTLACLPVHPRIGRVLVSAAHHGQLTMGATLAALMTERDIFHRPPDLCGDCDLDIRLNVVDGDSDGLTGIHRPALRTVRQVAQQLVALGKRHIATNTPLGEPLRPAQHVVTGFPDRVAVRRGTNSDRLQLANGHGARLHPTSIVRQAPLLVAVRMVGAQRGQRAEHLVNLASELAPEDLRLTEHMECFFDESSQKVLQRQSLRYLALELSSRPMGHDLDREQVERILAQAASAQPKEAFHVHKDRGARRFLARLHWLIQQRPDLELPDFNELISPGQPSLFIRQLCHGRRSFSELRHIDLVAAMRDALGYSNCSTIDRLAPRTLDLPDGSSRPLEYRADQPPVLSTRFERLFGLKQTPIVGHGPITLELLAPNRRPVQTTSDLANFWAVTYPQIRKELRGRYPKHPWPENPLTAKAGFYRRHRDKD
ncbi:MAG: ATP-dependent helicase HrpB [Myxococcota bacterium]|nr:ATP-dependent helicase HrpB [Myxococcota bacterium]